MYHLVLENKTLDQTLIIALIFKKNKIHLSISVKNKFILMCIVLDMLSILTEIMIKPQNSVTNSLTFENYVYIIIKKDS